jgi:SHS2 domain-containing protein
MRINKQRKIYYAAEQNTFVLIEVINKKIYLFNSHNIVPVRKKEFQGNKQWTLVLTISLIHSQNLFYQLTFFIK